MQLKWYFGHLCFGFAMFLLENEIISTTKTRYFQLKYYLVWHTVIVKYFGICTYTKLRMTNVVYNILGKDKPVCSSVKCFSTYGQMKGYLNCKTISCHKVSLHAQLMAFCIWRKNVSFSRYLDFYRHCCIMEVGLMLTSFES